MTEGAATAALLGTAWHGCYFDGQWQPGDSTLEVAEPATGDIIAHLGLVSPEKVATLAEKALKAHHAWAALAPMARARILRNVATILENHTPELVDWVVRETGGVAMKAGMEIMATAEEFNVAASLLIQPSGTILQSNPSDRISLARRVPLGVVAVITPWNVPLGLAVRSVAPALAMGNAVILKPDLHTPVSGGVILARALEAAGLPPGLFTMIPGGADVGEALVTAKAVRMVSFTGSTAVGRRVGTLAGGDLKRVALELGGNSPMLILDDADLDAAASAGAFGSFFHQGQICMATSRHIVDRRIADRYIALLRDKANALKVGNPALDPHVMIGPLINQRQRDRVQRIVGDSIQAGAVLEAGGSCEKLFYRPTVLSGVNPGMPAFDEEIFGPVAAVTVADDVNHAIRLANDTDYGLSAAVFTGSVERGRQVAGQLRAAMVHINDQTINDNFQAPMGGMGQSGNGARFSSMTAWDEFTEWQWTTSSERPARFPF